MKIANTRKLAFGLGLVMVAVAAVAAQIAPVRPADSQLHWARQAAGHAQVVWDHVSGAPLCVRGADLGARNLGGLGLAIKGAGDFGQDAVAALDRVAGLFRIRDARAEFKAYRVEADQLGFHHVRVHQVCRGLRVVGEGLVVHFNAAGRVV